MPRLKSLSLLLVASAGIAADVEFPDMALRTADNGRLLVRQSDRQPVFLLGDTAWPLPLRLTREDIVHYLDQRRQTGFNMILTGGIAIFGGLGPNRYGDRPFADLEGGKPIEENRNGDVCTYPVADRVTVDFTKPVITPGNDPAEPSAYDYWDHLEYFIRQAGERGMYVALNPMMATCYIRHGFVDLANAEAAGKLWGSRYGHFVNMVWVLGGDVTADRGPDDLKIHRLFAKGIAIGATGTEDYSRLTMTYHPQGAESTALWFHDDPWLDFNLIQSGHGEEPGYDIRKDYARTPVKPVLDGESFYEALPVKIRKGNRAASAWDVRMRAYWSVFSGAFGHIYGELGVMQMASPESGYYRDIPSLHWRAALDRPGAAQMGHMRRLMESRPAMERVPDQKLLAYPPMKFTDRIVATRGNGYLMVYSTSGNLIELHRDRIPGQMLRAWWFNPRTGEATATDFVDKRGRISFQPPSLGLGEDWVLVLDDASRNYPPPGKRKAAG